MLQARWPQEGQTGAPATGGMFRALSSDLLQLGSVPDRSGVNQVLKLLGPNSAAGAALAAGALESGAFPAAAEGAAGAEQPAQACCYYYYYYYYYDYY